MINYRSNAQFDTPAYQQSPADAAGQMSPYGNQNHRDIFGGLQQKNAVDLSRYAQQKQDEYESEAQKAQRELALAGLTMMSQAQNNAQNNQNSRMQMLLGGLL